MAPGERPFPSIHVTIDHVTIGNEIINKVQITAHVSMH
jgi:exo-beta-1,3-glucanase (GH17 family)